MKSLQTFILVFTSAILCGQNIDTEYFGVNFKYNKSEMKEREDGLTFGYYNLNENHSLPSLHIDILTWKHSLEEFIVGYNDMLYNPKSKYTSYVYKNYTGYYRETHNEYYIEKGESLDTLYYYNREFYCNYGNQIFKISYSTDNLKGLDKNWTSLLDSFKIKKSSKQKSPYVIYANENSYEATESFYYIQNSKTQQFVKQSETIEVSLGKKSSGGIVLLQKYNGDFYNRNTEFTGNLFLYLSDGSVIKCIDRKMFGYTDDTASAIYYLTDSEIGNLKKYDIVRVGYSLFINGFETKNFSAVNSNSNTSLAVQKLF